MKVSPEIVFKQKYNAFMQISSSYLLKNIKVTQTDIELLLIAKSISTKQGDFDMRELREYSGMSNSTIRNWREKMIGSGFILYAFNSTTRYYRLHVRAKLVINKYMKAFELIDI